MELELALSKLTVNQIRERIKAFKLLFGNCEISIKGHYDDDRGDSVFIDYSPRNVVSIGRKYLTVDLGNEGKCKINPLSDSAVPNRLIIRANGGM